MFLPHPLIIILFPHWNFYRNLGFDTTFRIRTVRIDPLNAQVKKVYRSFGIKLPNQFPLKGFIAETRS